MAVRALIVGGALAFAEASFAAHPVEKVIDLLQGLSAKAEAQHKEEEVAYTTFAHWCQNSKKSLKGSVTKGKATIDELSSTIASHKKNIEVLGKEVDALGAELLELDVSKSAAETDKQDGENLFKQEEQSLKDTIKGISDAISLLTQTKGNTDALLLQRAQRGVAVVAALAGATASPQQLAALQAFTEPRPDLKAAGDREDHVKKYGFKSDNVIELLKELQLKFEDELVEATKAQTNALNSFSLAMEAHNNLVKSKQDAKAGKKAEKGDSRAELIAAKASFQSATDDLSADSDTLTNTNSACSIKQAEWAERSDIRAKEKEALAAAVKILSKATGVRTEVPSNPVPPPSPVAFLQLPAANPKAEKAVQLLRFEAQVTHSQALEKLAATLASHEDGPFDQVINMVEKMIFRLQNEQKEEDEHKHWCDVEGNKTEASIENKQGKMAELTAKIDEATASIALLATEISDARDMVAEITQHEQEATEIRETGRKENAAAAKDAADAQKALANAVAVLNEFYKSSGAIAKEAWEFVQAPVTLSKTPSTWDSGYSGVADPAAQPDGIVTVLETISEDFARMESQTKAQESSDQEAFENEMKSATIEKARRSKEAEMKSQDRQRLVEKSASMVAKRKSVSGELDATQQYLKDLAPACFDGTSTYAERRSARDKEIVALKEAEDLLQDAFKAEPVAGTFLAKRKGGSSQGILTSR